MHVVELFEFDNPKDEERINKAKRFSRDVMRPYWEKLVKGKDIKVEANSWSDNTGHMINWSKYETMEDFAKLWNDERWQQMMARWVLLVDNGSVRLLRPAVTIPEDLYK